MLNTHTHTHTHIHTQCAYSRACVHTHTHTRMHACMHAHTHTHKHTHKHSYSTSTYNLFPASWTISHAPAGTAAEWITFPMSYHEAKTTLRSNFRTVWLQCLNIQDRWRQYPPAGQSSISHHLQTEIWTLPTPLPSQQTEHFQHNTMPLWYRPADPWPHPAVLPHL